MQLTTKRIEKYQGGQIEIQNQQADYTLRGEIATIVVEKNVLKVRFAWLAKCEKCPPVLPKWVKAESIDYEVRLKVHFIMRMGPGRLAVTPNWRTGSEHILFYPNNPYPGNKLDPAEVEGLELNQT